MLYIVLLIFTVLLFYRHTCSYCDYSAPSAGLAELHESLHEKPNRNLLATQSIMNLTQLKPISADTHLNQTAEIVNGEITDAHDHLQLYENMNCNKSQQNGSVSLYNFLYLRDIVTFTNQ